jgi:hypothetical protein
MAEKFMRQAQVRREEKTGGEGTQQKGMEDDAPLQSPQKFF